MHITPLTPTVQGWLSNLDIKQARTLKHWLEEELQVSIAQVIDLEVQTDMIEEWMPNGLYKTFKPGNFNHITLTLLNGDKLHRSFRRNQ